MSTVTAVLSITAMISVTAMAIMSIVIAMMSIVIARMSIVIAMMSNLQEIRIHFLVFIVRLCFGLKSFIHICQLQLHINTSL